AAWPSRVPPTPARAAPSAASRAQTPRSTRVTRAGRYPGRSNRAYAAAKPASQPSDEISSFIDFLVGELLPCCCGGGAASPPGHRCHPPPDPRLVAIDGMRRRAPGKGNNRYGQDREWSEARRRTKAPRGAAGRFSE